MKKQFACLTLPLLIFSLDGTQAAPETTTGPGGNPGTPEAVIQKHMQAAGGRAALERIQSQLSQCDVKEGGESFKAEVRFKANKLLLTVTGPGFEVRQGHDGHGRWWRHDPRGVQEFKEAKDRLDFRELSLCLSATALLEIQKHFARLEIAGEEKVGSFDCHVLEGKMDEGPSIKLWFDVKSGLLSKVGSSVLEEYGLENGIQVPHLIRKGDGSVVKVKNVQFNTAMDDTQFAMPSGMAAPNDSAGSEFEYATALNPGTQLGVARQPASANFGRPPKSSLPAYRPDSRNPFQVDLRSTDISGVALDGRLSDLLHADFDNQTVWPAKLPEGFDPALIMDRAKNPGLRVKELHRKGITGKGIGLAIIDQTLLVDHLEYRDQVRSYEEIHSPPGAAAQMHGPAVASIAVGKTVGVAPAADLYYIAETHGAFQQGKFDWDFTWLAKSVDRILEINAALPKERKIRVISVSVGWSPGQKGCDETDAAVRRATEAGIFVISTALERTHKLAFHGLGRDACKDPDQVDSYGLGSWWANTFLRGQRRFAPGERLLVPMDARTTASPTGVEDYVFYSTGGWSWSVPYIAGLYALACQVRPDMTPEVFWTTALKTGRVIPVGDAGANLELGNIVDPVALIDALQKTK